MTVNAVTDADFEQVVLQSSTPVLVDYWATWCSPCKQIAPILDELSEEFAGRVTFVKMDADANPLTPTNYHVMGLPTLQIFVDGQIVKVFEGGKTKSTLKRALEEYAL